MRENWCASVVGSLIRLVPYGKHHVEKYHEWMTDPKLLEATASEALSLEEEYAMQVSWHENPKNCTFIILRRDGEEGGAEASCGGESGLGEGPGEERCACPGAVAGKDEEISRMVGDVNLFLHDADDPGNAEIEIMVADEASRGRGYGREALCLMMHYGVASLRVTRFFAKIHETNETSLRLFESLGYVRVNFVEAFREWELELRVGGVGGGETASRIAEQAAHSRLEVYQHQQHQWQQQQQQQQQQPNCVLPEQAGIVPTPENLDEEDAEEGGKLIMAASVFSFPRTHSQKSAKLPQLPPQDADVYEPSDDTFLLCDALEQDRASLQALLLPTALEIGSGSGCVITFLALLLKEGGGGNEGAGSKAARCRCFATDINPRAVHMTAATTRLNSVDDVVEVVQTRMAQGLCLFRSIDVLVFNPPYVPTPDDEVGGTGIAASWAGGEHGRVVIDAFLPLLPALLSPRGICYLVLVEDNKPADVARRLAMLGLEGHIVLKRQAFNEGLQIMRINHRKV